MTLLLEQEYQLVDVSRLRQHPRNPRRGDVDAIAESIEHHGFFGAVIVQRSTGFVLVGNHRLLVAREKGATVLPVIWVDVDDDQALRIMLVENKLNDRATYLDEVLADVLADVDRSATGPLGTGFDQVEIDEILALADRAEPLTDPDDAPDLPDEDSLITRPGDVWRLGPHRLVCGDATDVDAVRAALGERAAALLFTDPPYGVSYQGGTRDKLRIANDDLEAGQLEDLLAGAFDVAHQVLAPGASFYVCSPSGVLESTFRRALDRTDLPLRQQLVWVKNSFVLGRSDYHGQHESLLYGWQLGGEPTTPPHFDLEHEALLYGWDTGAAHTWEGGRKQSTVWQYDKPRRSEVHPTMKPVALVQRAVENNTRPAGAVLDTFAGAGATLIACSLSGRIAALVELEPKYCDVICRRYQDHAGVLPVLERTGDQVDFNLTS